MRFRSVTVSRLDRLIAALEGPADAARVFGVHRSTLNRWRTGARPIPAWAATRMRELATEISQEMIRLAYELKTDIRQGEDRRARMIGRGRANLYALSQSRRASRFVSPRW
jgi:DNA-binding transcriptional regulator YdaS (Cro superfamily)